jgi:hypothetical protein
VKFVSVEDAFRGSEQLYVTANIFCVVLASSLESSMYKDLASKGRCRSRNYYSAYDFIAYVGRGAERGVGASIKVFGEQSIFLRPCNFHGKGRVWFSGIAANVVQSIFRLCTRVLHVEAIYRFFRVMNSYFILLTSVLAMTLNVSKCEK